MNIVCCGCGAKLGVQEPFDDVREIKAKCTSCLNKEIEEASRYQPMPRPGEKVEIVLKNDIKGTIWIPEGKDEKLSLWDIAVSGRKFFCSDETKEEFQKYLLGLEDTNPEITFLYSMSIKIAPPVRGRRKAKEHSEPEKRQEQSIEYNCTAKIPKYYIQLIFNDKTNNVNRFINIIAKSVNKSYQESQSPSLAP